MLLSDRLGKRTLTSITDTEATAMAENHVTLPELFRLDGRVAIVTGASSGLGVAFAQGLAEAPAPTW
jgi:hypothetical protein